MSQSRNTRRSSLSAASLAGEKRTPLGLVGSLVLHVAVIAATFFTWQHSLVITDETPPVVPVDLVTIGDKTNIKPVVPKNAPFKPTKAPQPITAPKVDAVAPTPVEMSAPKFEVAPPPPEEATSEPVVTPKPAPPQPKLRPRPPAPAKKKRAFDVNNILALLNKQKASSESAPQGQAGEQARKGIGAQNAMTMDLRDALRNQIEQCWSPPVGAPNAAELVVNFEVYLNPDGSIARPPQLAGQSGSGAYAQAAAAAARRAIYTCAPYKLPADRYNQWRDITMTFDPRQMMGQ